jgi:hypothetical protein
MHPRSASLPAAGQATALAATLGLRVAVDLPVALAILALGLAELAQLTQIT